MWPAGTCEQRCAAVGRVVLSDARCVAGLFAGVCRAGLPLVLVLCLLEAQAACVLLLHSCRYLKDVKVGQNVSLAQALASNLGPKLQGQVCVAGTGEGRRGVLLGRRSHAAERWLRLPVTVACLAMTVALRSSAGPCAQQACCLLDRAGKV